LVVVPVDVPPVIPVFVAPEPPPGLDLPEPPHAEAPNPSTRSATRTAPDLRFKGVTAVLLPTLRTGFAGTAALCAV